MSKQNRRVAKMTLCALLAAMYVLLSTYLGIKVGNFLHITFASLPVILAAILMGPTYGVLVAGMGEFINQLLSYGLSPTMPLWMLPPMCRGLIVGLLVLAACKKGRQVEKTPLLLGGILMTASVVSSVVTTFVMWADSVFWGYYSFVVVFGASIHRMISSLITAVVITLICIPVVTALRKLPMLQKK